MVTFGTFCSGIEAPSVAWGDDWQTAFVAEIEPFPCFVLSSHYGAGRPEHMPDPNDPDLADQIEAAQQADIDRGIKLNSQRKLSPAEERQKARIAAIKEVSRLPETGKIRNLGDMTQIDPGDVPPVDIMCAGTPCQDFSVAGLRKSLDGHRGNLTLTFLRMVHEHKSADGSNGPRWVVWENVPGILSLPDNPFGNFLAGLVGADTALVPPSGLRQFWGFATVERDGKKRQVECIKWPSAGMVIGPTRTAAWRVVDSQFFGVAQRRSRLYVVSGRTGDDTDPGAVLFEGASMRRHSPPRREARARASSDSDRGPAIHPVGIPGRDVAATLNTGTERGGFRTEPGEHLVAVPVVFDGTQITNGENRSNPQPGDPCPTLHAQPLSVIEQKTVHCHEVACTLNTKLGDKMGLENQHINSGAPLFDHEQRRASLPPGTGAVLDQLAALPGCGIQIAPREVADPFRACGRPGENSTDEGSLVLAVRTAQTNSNGIGVSEIAHTLDLASGQAIVQAAPLAFRPEDLTRQGGANPSDVAPPLVAGNGSNSACGCVVTNIAPPVAHTLKAEGADGAEDGSSRGIPLVMAFKGGQSHQARGWGIEEDISPTLSAGGGGGNGQPYVAVFSDGAGGSARGIGYSEEVSPTLHAADAGSNRAPCVFHTTQDPISSTEVAPCLAGNHRSNAVAEEITETLQPQGMIQPGGLYGSEKERNTVAALCAMREEIGAQAFAEWGLGILNTLQSPQVLQSDMHGDLSGCQADKGRSMLGDGASSFQEGLPKGAVREVRSEESGGTPQRWELAEQFARELRAALSQLPHERTQAESYLCCLWHAGEGIRVLRQALSAIQKTWEPVPKRRFSVRRLTPAECEKLQGFWRGYTAVAYRRNRAKDLDEWARYMGLAPEEAIYIGADSLRYKAIGNSMTTQVLKWIKRQLLKVDPYLREHSK